MDPEPLDPHYVQARRVLLDALFALAPHGKAIVVAGAQAIYLHTGDADFAIAPFTIDSDFVINPSLLGDNPLLEAAMREAGFELSPRPQGHLEPGIWVTPALVGDHQELIAVDLIVPEGAAPPGGRRGARLGVHGNRAARRIPGLEAALIDHSPMQIMPLDAADTRSMTAEVAGPAALLVAKAHKLHDRVEDDRSHRIKDKDASDVVRLMQTTTPATLAVVFEKLLNDPVAGTPTRDGLDYLRQLFGRRGRPGVTMCDERTDYRNGSGHSGGHLHLLHGAAGQRARRAAPGVAAEAHLAAGAAGRQGNANAARCPGEAQALPVAPSRIFPRTASLGKARPGLVAASQTTGRHHPDAGRNKRLP
jgi:hypothetical protein